MNKKFILSIDQGTTSTRALIYSQQAQPIAQHQIEFKQYFPEPAWVEHDAEEIWQSVLECCRTAIQKANINIENLAAIGISNQRETTIIWDRKTGAPIYTAIVWQDRRTADFCKQLSAQKNTAQMITDKTGLLIDPYFSATKIVWLLDNIPNARKRADQGELAFGTIDSFLLWRLTNGKVHATDITNAARTLLFNIHTQTWDEKLLNLFNIPKSLLPQVLDNNAHFGDTDKTLFGKSIPITGMAGDQQAAAIGQACLQAGMIKSTYGTGCFVLLNTGSKIVTSKNRLITTIAYKINRQINYALEGSIFVAGAAIKWLRDQLHLIKNASESESLASSVSDTCGVYLVPAFTGLGAPYWDPNARGAIFGLTRDTQIAHIVRAALEAVGYQTRDLLIALQNDYGNAITTLRVDGGMCVNNWLLQFLADILNITVERPAIIETSSLGAAYLAGLGAGIFQSLDEISMLSQSDKIYTSQMDNNIREDLYTGWLTAVSKVCP